VSAAPGAQLAPPTDLDGLAALLAAAGCTVCNNSGPMHLSVAVGAPTLALFLKMDPDRWGYRESPHAVLDLTPVIDVPARAAEEIETTVRRFLTVRSS
jgi:ADP-heptose:LPS heptosyltransferase